MTDGIREEVAGSTFKDKRLKNRFLEMMEALWEKFGESIPSACGGWANTKAAYRFFSNESLRLQN